MRDEWACQKLRKATEDEMKRSGEISGQFAAKHSEYIGVKVALGVLLLLFVLQLVEPSAPNKSLSRGLNTIHSVVTSSFPKIAENDIIEPLVQAQVENWVTPYVGDLTDGFSRKMLYLDIGRRVFCNELSAVRKPCVQAVGSAATWGDRTSLVKVVEQIDAHTVRAKDVVIKSVAPDINDDNAADLSAEEYDARTLSFVVMSGEDDMRKEALNSIFTTCAVIFFILGGITALTKDLSFLSENLLKPLTELADELQNIVHLQLAGCSSAPAADGQEEVRKGDKDVGAVSEVRLIRKTFENMKKAIKSWGKYVPWPVVQMLLYNNVKAGLEVAEKEVTVFFSDIASFTTIVESLPPESSLLLLSRYFHDMSRVIDEHGGIVLEYIGDAILCVYGAPMANEHHPAAGVKGALRMMAYLERTNAYLTARSMPVVGVRCGLHTGNVLVGNMGFQSRMKYGIVGEEGNVPGKLEEMNKNYETQILISQSLHDKIMSDTEETEEFITRPVDIVHLRPHISSLPERVYEVRQPETVKARLESVQSAMLSHKKALDMYEARQFDKAATTFAHVKSLMGDLTGKEDVPSSIMLRRCRAYLDQPPPDDWDGSGGD
jgi:class 3 adenylate cyclase